MIADNEDRRRWVFPSAAHTTPDQDARRLLIEAEHPELGEALRSDREALVEGKPINPGMHIAIHEIVANQIWDHDPPETWQNAKRLMDLGFDRHEVLHMLASVVAKHTFYSLRERTLFDREQFASDLASLPESPELDDGPEDDPFRDIYELDDCCIEALEKLLTAYDASAGDADVLSLAEILGHGCVADAFIELTNVHDDVECADGVRLFIKPIADVAERSCRAAANYVLAACAEAARDHLEAESLITSALVADPMYEPALEAAAWFAEDRGDAPRAISLLQRAGNGPESAQIERLNKYAAPGPHSAGRNDPCPCGSGRKYKVCCSARRGWALPDRARWLYFKAVAYAQRPGACQLVFDLADVRAGGDREAAAVASFDELVVDLALFEEGLFEEFLDGRGPLLPADELDLGRQWVGTQRRIFDVVEVRPNEALVLRDVDTGEGMVVTEKLGTPSLHEGDWILARVVPNGAGHIAVGGTLKISLRLRDSARKLIGSNPDGFEIARWIAAGESLPVLRTMEDEEIVFCKATFEISDPAKAGLALEQVLKRDEAGFVDLVEVKGQDYVRGFVRLAEDSLIVEANSVERLDRLKATLADAVPEARLVSENRTPLEQAMEEASGSSEPEDGEELIPPEARVALEEWLAAREKQWIDEPVPALGGMTPRAASSNPERRRDLIALLREFDRESSSVRVSGMNVARLRDLLGLDA